MYHLPKLNKQQAAEFADFLIDLVKTGKYDKYRTFIQVKTAVETKLKNRGKKGLRMPVDMKFFKSEIINQLGFDGEKVQIPADKESILKENLVQHLVGRQDEAWDTDGGPGDWRLRQIFHDSGIDILDKNIFGFEGKIGIEHTGNHWRSYVMYRRLDNPKLSSRDVFPLKEQGDNPLPPKKIGLGQVSNPHPVIIGTRDV